MARRVGAHDLPASSSFMEWSIRECRSIPVLVRGWADASVAERPLPVRRGKRGTTSYRIGSSMPGRARQVAIHALAHTRERDMKQNTILIVDDAPLDRAILAAMLRKHHYRVLEATNGQEGIHQALLQQPALIILDILLPDMDGYAVGAYLKAQAQTHDIPLIFLSAVHDTTSKTQCFALGGADYITKPFQSNEVLARVQHQIALQHVAQGLLTANQRLVEQQRRLDEDLQAAAHIQQSLIVPEHLKLERIHMAWRYLPCQQLGGDIFHVYRLDEDHLGLFMLDVCGHGIAAAMVAVSVFQRLTPDPGGLLKQRQLTAPYYRLTPPAEVLYRLDEAYPMERYEKYCTLTYMVLNWRQGWLTYSSAAHPPPLLVHRDGQVTPLRAGGSMIGLGVIAPFEEETVTLQAGDRLFLYTDGLVEGMDRHHESFGMSRLLSAIKVGQALSLQTACDQLMDQFFAHIDRQSPQDDVSLLALEYQGPETIAP